MTIQPTRRRAAFTLVEMLVVIAIIGVLVALLLPAVVGAINAARRARNALEVSQLANAVEAYKNKFGDYPPTFRSHDVFIRHVRKCYPRIDSTPSTGHLALVEQAIWGTNNFTSGTTPTPNIEEGEALVFWLALVDNDTRQPFKALLGTQPVSAVNLYDFDQRRLFDGTDTDLVPYYRAPYADETGYILIDNRAYSLHDQAAETKAQVEGTDTTAQNQVRPYAASSSSFINPTTFQIICAGQDGNFGEDPSPLGPKVYPSGLNYQEADNDNQTNFSEGRRLGDAIPQ